MNMNRDQSMVVGDYYWYQCLFLNPQPIDMPYLAFGCVKNLHATHIFGHCLFSISSNNTFDSHSTQETAQLLKQKQPIEFSFGIFCDNSQHTRDSVYYKLI